MFLYTMGNLLFVPLQTRLFNDFYKLRCDENNIRWSGHITPPSRANLYKFVEKCIHEENRFVFLAYSDKNECIGYVYCDVDDNQKTIESSYGVYYPYNGQGYGTQIIEFSNRYGKLLGMQEHIAWVSEHNIASNRVFQKNGFVISNEVEIRKLPLLGGEHNFLKWVKKL